MQFRVKPRSHITTKVAISEVGIASSTMIVLRQRVQEEEQHEPGQQDDLDQAALHAVAASCG